MHQVVKKRREVDGMEDKEREENITQGEATTKHAAFYGGCGTHA